MKAGSTFESLPIPPDEAGFHAHVAFLMAKEDRGVPEELTKDETLLMQLYNNIGFAMEEGMYTYEMLLRLGARKALVVSHAFLEAAFTLLHSHPKGEEEIRRNIERMAIT